MTFGVSRSTESTISRTVGGGDFTEGDDDAVDRATALLAAQPPAPAPEPSVSVDDDDDDDDDDDGDAKSDTVFRIDDAAADEDGDADAASVSSSG